MNEGIPARKAKMPRCIRQVTTAKHCLKTKISNSGNLVTSGGRVISVTSLADTYNEAIKRSYQTIKKIKFEKMYYRKDIGFDL